MAEQDVIEQFENVDIAGMAASTGDVAMDIILLFLGVLLFGAIVGYIVYISIHNRKVRVRYKTRHGMFIIDDWARKRKKDGAEWWKLRKLKIEATPPPSRAIELTKKGKMVAECYLSEDNPEPIWIVDEGPGEGKEFTPITTQERALIVSRIRKAESRKRKDLWTNIKEIAIPVIMLMMVAIPFVFWGDITKTSQDAITAVNNIQAENAKISEQNARILSVMAGKLEAGEIRIAQDIPPSEQVGGGVDG